MPQINFAPTIAALMGVPLPFGNVGQVSEELWAVAHSLRNHESGGTSGTNKTEPSQETYVEALRSNAAQVTCLLCVQP